MPTAKEILEQYCAAMEKGADECMALMADDVVLRAPTMAPPIPQEVRGLAQVRPLYEMLFAQVFDEFRWTYQVYATDDDEVAFATAASTPKLRNGLPYKQDYAIYSRVKDGKIVEHTEFMDSNRFQKASVGLFGPAA